jgi:hypothetical protein
MACKKPFHVNCFAVYHSDQFGRDNKAAIEIIKTALTDKSKKRNFTKITDNMPAQMEDVSAQFTRERIVRRKVDN